MKMRMVSELFELLKDNKKPKFTERENPQANLGKGGRQFLNLE